MTNALPVQVANPPSPEALAMPAARAFGSGSNDVYLMSLESGPVVLKLYAGPNGSRRRDCELGTLALWRSAGIAVPSAQPLELTDVTTPYLVRDYIPGCSLRDYLRTSGQSLALKLEAVKTVCYAMFWRHQLMFETGDRRLAHPDANTGNVILRGEALHWIDFEMLPQGDDLVDVAAVELSKFLLCAVQDMTIVHLPSVLAAAVSAYASRPDVLVRLWQRTLYRPLQSIHRWRDRRRKQQQPGQVTKYDIADGLRKLLSRPAMASRLPHDESSEKPLGSDVGWSSRSAHAEV